MWITIKNNICKHIHACVRFIFTSSENTAELHVQEGEALDYKQINSLFPFFDLISEVDNLLLFRTKVETVLGYLSCDSSYSVYITDEEISILSWRADSKKSKPITEASEEPANKNVEK